MKKIFKININCGVNFVRMPVGARIVEFKKQGYWLCVWYEFDVEARVGDDVKLTVYGTGHEIPKDEEYVDTCFDDTFVWHLYKKKIIQGEFRE